ncbi:hypothetical protein AN641_06040 [Candidatus Epulonipiscioides gigas]|nr:hypothetical protein AN641_06040 [Epulopiscium sp. SCG-C07WGA-EpuloA2]
MKWNSKLYDSNQHFVSQYGESLLEFLPDNTEQSILDLGCGTGDLTAQIFEQYPNTIGIDSSLEMIERAQSKYPKIKFLNISAYEMDFFDKFDVVFSNAVFHWILDQNKLHYNIYNSLHKNGILICEFGANKNIDKIFNAYNKSIKKYNQKINISFYFPEIINHKKLLEQHGFKIKEIYDFDRPTVLPNGRLGLREWVLQFFSSDINKYNSIIKEDILQNMETILRNELFKQENWVADYRRIRVIAKK